MSYRDDHDALRSYHDDLARQLASLELESVDAERARVQQELVRVRRDLAHLTARRNPIRLDTLRVASPCKEPWDRMVGTDRVRDCAKCEKPVFDLSTLTTEEAEALLATRGVTMCVRFFKRADGTVLTADCPVGQRSQRKRVAIAAGLFAGAAGAAGVAATAGGDAPAKLEPIPETTFTIAPEVEPIPPPVHGEMMQGLALPSPPPRTPHAVRHRRP